LQFKSPTLSIGFQPLRAVGSSENHWSTIHTSMVRLLSSA